MKYENYGLIKESWERFLDEDEAEFILEADGNFSFQISDALPALVAVGGLAGASYLAVMAAKNAVKSGANWVNDQVRRIANVKPMQVDSVLDIATELPLLTGRLAKAVTAGQVAKKLKAIQELQFPEKPTGPNGETLPDNHPEMKVYNKQVERLISMKVNAGTILNVMGSSKPEDIVRNLQTADSAAKKEIQSQVNKVTKATKGPVRKLKTVKGLDPSGMFSTVGRKK